MNNHYIEDLVKEGEHQQQDFKFEISDAKKIARSMVAFANTDGGRLLIGIKDNGKISGINTSEESHMIEAASQMYSKPNVPYQMKQWNVKGKIVLEVIISFQLTKPYYALTDNNKWMAFFRYLDQNRLANKIMIRVWQKQKTKKGIFIRYSNAEKLILDYLNVNSNITSSRFCKLAKISRKQSEEIISNFIILNILEFDYSRADQIRYRLKSNTEPIR